MYAFQICFDDVHTKTCLQQMIHSTQRVFAATSRADSHNCVLQNHVRMIGSITFTTAAWTMRSRTVGIPNGRVS